jgi:hypothetical protein
MRHTPPDFIPVPPAMKQRLDEFREKHDGEPIGKVANHVLYEDEKVRIWEMKLAPGEHSDLHHHALPYYLVIFSGDLVAGVTPKGSPVDSFLARVPEGGNTVSIPAGGTEWAYNVGTKTYHEILIELKQA